MVFEFITIYAMQYDDLERTLMTINGKAYTCVLAGDINTDIIKFENEGTMNYLTTLFSYRFLPYITLPSRIMNFYFCS